MFTEAWSDVVAHHRRVLRTQYAVIFLLVMWGMYVTHGWLRAQEVAQISFPPILDYGAVLTVGNKSSWEVYTFAGYIWQQIGIWNDDGAKNSIENLQRLQVFLTSKAYSRLSKEIEVRALNGELLSRTRQVVPQSAYELSAVTIREHEWQVILEQRIIERVGALTVKDHNITYALVIVPNSANPEANPWQLAIDSVEVLSYQVRGESHDNY